MNDYKLLTEDELRLAALIKNHTQMVLERDKARIIKAAINLDIKNLNTLIIDMEVDIQKLEDDKVVCPDLPKNEREPINIHTPT